MFKKIGHITFVLFLLFSTVGLTINLHYCKNNLYDIAVFSEADNCCLDNEHKHTHHPANNIHSCQSENHSPKDCEDETIQFESIDDYVVSFIGFDFDSNNVLTLLFNLYLDVTAISQLDKLNLSSKIPILEFSPPKIQVILALLQTYLR